jgi:hypothetical protein
MDDPLDPNEELERFTRSQVLRDTAAAIEGNLRAQVANKPIITTTNTITQSDNILGLIVPVLAQTPVLLDKISTTAATRKDLMAYDEEATGRKGNLAKKLDQINERLDKITTKIEDSEEREVEALNKVEQRLGRIELEPGSPRRRRHSDGYLGDGRGSNHLYSEKTGLSRR